MKITQVNTVLLTGPSSSGDPFLDGFKKWRSAALVEITTDTELAGVGEVGVGYHLPEIVPPIVEFFAPILVGLDEAAIEPRRLWQRMHQCAGFWTRSGIGMSVLAGLEAALWDLLGKMRRQPVHELLGGCLHDSLRCYASGCESPMPWDQLRRKVDLFRDAGFTSVKLAAGWYDHNTGSSFESTSAQAWVDMESDKLQALRSHVGADFGIALDGHMGNVDEGKYVWDVGTAAAVLRALEPFDLLFFEEPLDYRDTRGYVTLCGSTSIPVAGGEVLSARHEFEGYAQHNAFDIAQPDASVVGIWAMLDIANMFAARARSIAPHNWMSGPAVMANIHAAFACPNVAIVEMPPLPGGLHTDIYGEGLRFESGRLLPPQAFGLGVRLDDRVKTKHAFKPGSGEWNLVPGKDHFPALS